MQGGGIYFLNQYVLNYLFLELLAIGENLCNSAISFIFFDSFELLAWFWSDFFAWFEFHLAPV